MILVRIIQLAWEVVILGFVFCLGTRRLWLGSCAAVAAFSAILLFPLLVLAQVQPEAPTSVEVYTTTSGNLEVRWSSTDFGATTGFKIQWKSGSEEFESSRQALSDPSASVVDMSSTASSRRYKHVIGGLTDGTQYLVRVAATNAHGDSVPSSEAQGTPQSTAGRVLDFIENEVVAIHETSFPWLRDALRYLVNNNISVNFTSGTGGSTRTGCNSYSPNVLSSCAVELVELGRSSSRLVQTTVHELGHVYTLTNGISNNPGPLGIANVYLSRLNLEGSRCIRAELYADLLLLLVLGDIPGVATVYWSPCVGTNSSLTDEAVAVVGSAARGEIPEWFSATYNQPDGEPDLEAFWEDVKDLSSDGGPFRFRFPVVYQLRTAFGGYCSEREAWRSAIGNGVTRNPWRDGGCVPQAPGSLTVTPEEGGMFTVSWVAPSDDGGSPIEGFKIQWIAGSEVFGSSRQAVVTNLASLSYAVSGLSAGRYKVRILAYNNNGDGTASNEATVTVTGANDPPTITGPEGVNYQEDSTDVIATLVASDPENDPITWALTGADTDDLRISHRGQLSFQHTPDHENPTDSNRDNKYEVTVQASDRNHTVTQAVAVTVTNEDEPGTVTLSPQLPRVGIPLRAVLSDPDGVVSDVTWMWYRSPNKFGQGDAIRGPTSATYTPVIDDEDMVLRAKASYTDPHGSGKTAEGVTANKVEPEPLLGLRVSHSRIAEGMASTITVSIQNGTTFSQNRTVTLSLSGTATLGSDYTINQVSITITAGTTSSYAVVRALTDSVKESDETIIVQARHDQQLIGTSTVTIPANGGSGSTNNNGNRGNRGGGGGGGGRGGGRGGGGGGGGSSGGEVDDGLPPTASELFEDINPGVWYEQAVTWMILHKVTSGCATTMFCPDANLTRQQFVTFLWRAAGRPTPTYQGSEAFKDVPEGTYSDRAIGWAVSNGTTVGCTQGTFGDPDWRFCPTRPVTRGQMATLLYRHVEADHTGAAPPYTDVEPDKFYTPSITWLTDFQVVPGCGPQLFCPNRNATRAEAALFINGVAIRPHIWGPGNTSFRG